MVCWLLDTYPSLSAACVTKLAERLAVIWLPRRPLDTKTGRWVVRV